MHSFCAPRQGETYSYVKNEQTIKVGEKNGLGCARKWSAKKTNGLGCARKWSAKKTDPQKMDKKWSRNGPSQDLGPLKHH